MRRTPTPPGNQRSHLCKGPVAAAHRNPRSYLQLTEAQENFLKDIGKNWVKNQHLITPSRPRRSAGASPPAEPAPPMEVQLRDKGNPATAVKQMLVPERAVMMTTWTRQAQMTIQTFWGLMNGRHRLLPVGPGKRLCREWRLSKLTTMGSCGSFYRGT